ncbi:aldo/keto reductase [Caloramator sp. E03]|uniref:aldo/keto reductase n=1 Tax=Caloramator sp. E03 TaxID=2576307 RepID=UPI0011103236|nr:aldo/keto reductase [Caloramator sp. E03]QCX32736.1 aldo/keto reductase [Caloramator sp. E03]
MEYVRLGKTGLVVSKLCFGGLTVGPLQANLDIEEGAKVIATAFDMGVNFIDTAKLYKTYPYIKRAIELSKNKNIIISSKSYDYTYEGMRESVQEALEELGLKKLSIFCLHEQESRLTLKGHSEALRYLIDAKKCGIIDAVGVSTHAVEVVEAICTMEEIDVIHPIVNIKGLGIIDGSIDDMLKAVEKANKSGKGIYSMKPLGGGNLMSNSTECFSFVLNNPNIHSIAVGMQSLEEVYTNISIFEGRTIDEDILTKLKNRKRRLHIDSWCKGCGECEKKCKNKAIKVVNNKAKVDEDKCVLCGYCSAYCPEFCIKIV